MVGPKKVTQEVYDKFRSNMEKKYNYDEMSDEQKQAFNEKLDEIVGTEDSGEDDPGDNEIGAKVLRRSR